MAEFNALQIALKSIHFDRPTDHRMSGYVVGLAQRNIDGPGQLYVSQGSFKVRRDGDARTRDDEVFRWDGNGELIFSTKLAGLEQVQLNLWFVRDRRRLREAGEVLKDMFGDADGLGSQLADVLGNAIGSTNPATGAIVALLPKVAKFIGGLLERTPDGVKIFSEGSVRMNQFFRDLDAEDLREETEILWGQNLADKGYFVTSWDLVTMSNPERVLTHPELPEPLKHRMGL